MNTLKQNIVIIGAGYSGILAARRLAGKTRGAHITLINPFDSFVERVRLHQLAAGQTLKHIPLQKMLRGRRVDFLQGKVTHIQPDAHTLTVQSENGAQIIAYHKLIYALGSFIDSSKVPGAAEYALTVNNPQTTLILRQRLTDAAAKNGRLVICGGGLTGIETATEFAESYPNLKVTLITRENFGAQLSRRGAAYMREAFAKRGIELIDQTTITRITPDSVDYAGGSLPCDVCLWSGAFAVPTLARDSGLTVNSRGQVIVDAHLRSVSHPDVYAIGDSADLGSAIDTPIRMACATAMPMGSYAADHITAELAGKTHRPYQFAYTLRCISLGRSDGLVQFVDANDNPKESILTGWLGARVKEMICRYTIWQIFNDQWMYNTPVPRAKTPALKEERAKS